MKSTNKLNIASKGIIRTSEPAPTNPVANPAITPIIVNPIK